MKWLSAAASKDHAVVQCNLTFMYPDGVSLARDFHKAAELFRKSAERAHANAHICYGYACVRGRCVSENKEESVERYELAASQSLAIAQYNLGVMYRDDMGVKQDVNTSTDYMLLNAHQGEAFAQNGLAFACQRGLRVAKSDEEAVLWYAAAAAQGDASGQYKIGVMYRDGRGFSKDVRKATELFQQSA